jgi:hypothetical protein
MAQEYSQVNFRIPSKLKEDIEKAAFANNRSITSELVSRLEQSFEQPPSAELSPAQLEQITKAAGASYMAVIAKHLESLSEDDGNKVLRNIVKEAAEDFEHNKKAP